MYSTKSGLILGFHGTDNAIVNKVVNNIDKHTYKKSKYDWLGHGLYFWEYGPQRALDFAKLLKKEPHRSSIKIENPDVLGAVIDLGKCLDFTVQENLSLLKEAYEVVKVTYEKNGEPLPVNKKIDGGEDLLLRDLDCLVIETIHKIVGKNEFDSVRGVFWEGPDLYPGAGFKEKDHIQICVRNPNCIKGYFLPRELNKKFKRV